MREAPLQGHALKNLSSKTARGIPLRWKSDHVPLLLEVPQSLPITLKETDLPNGLVTRLPANAMTFFCPLASLAFCCSLKAQLRSHLMSFTT